VSATHPYSRAAGAFRVLCLATRRWSTIGGDGEHAPPGSAGAKVVLVTSAEARDGKTTVAANLAVAYAQEGSRVLVVSADLRRPAIHRPFRVPDRPGLVDLLDDPDPEASLDPAPYLEPCSVVRVAVLPSGITSEDPGELLGSVRMRRFMERLRRITDVVVIDCAPLVVASDVIPLLPQVDGVVLVARAGKTRRALAANAAELLQRMGAHQVGVVLNDAREFSIPLAKRRMYRPTRKMRKAAQRATRSPAREAVAPEPVVSTPDAEIPAGARAGIPARAGEPSRDPVAVPEAGSYRTPRRCHRRPARPCRNN
jgi:capsular exopolysaccharide synthesis family protein